MCRSISTTSGGSRRPAATASAPSAASPTTSRSADAARARQQPLPVERVVVDEDDPGRHRATCLSRQPEPHHGAPSPRPGAHVQRAGELVGTLAHRTQPDTGTRLLGQAAAVVAHRQDQPSARCRQVEPHRTPPTRAGPRWSPPRTRPGRPRRRPRPTGPGRPRRPRYTRRPGPSNRAASSTSAPGRPRSSRVAGRRPCTAARTSSPPRAAAARRGRGSRRPPPGRGRTRPARSRPAGPPRPAPDRRRRAGRGAAAAAPPRGR